MIEDVVISVTVLDAIGIIVYETVLITICMVVN